MIRSVAPDGRPDVGGVFRPIDRPRVLERLATAAQYRIVTIIAPAGFGKSVAVRQYLATVPSAVVYDVPSDATSLVPFVRGFADALAEIAPGLRHSLATALDGARASENPGRDLAAWAATHIRTLDTLIALDDLHVGEGDPEVSRFVTALVDRTKGGPRWLFSSRTPLQLPVASWLAYGESDLMVDAVDLRFSGEEAKQSARASRLTVRDDELAAINDLVDGWPTALAFAFRVSIRASDLRTVSAGTREMVYRYLAEQVWHSLDDRMRAFLRTVVFLPRMDVRLAVAAGFDDAASIIERLRERVAFVTVVDAGVYQLHDLFRDFIHHQIELEGDDALRRAAVAAARVLEAAGMPAAALERYIETNAPDDVARVLAEANFTLLESGHYDVVERALRLLSGPRAQTPGVLAVRAAIEEAHGRVEQAEKLYEAALDRNPEDLSFHVAVAWRYGLLLYQQGRLDAIPRLEKLAGRPDLNDADRAHVEGSLAMVKAIAGDLEGAQASLDRAIPLAEFVDDLTRARTYGRAATVAFFAGEDDTVERLTREAIRLASDANAFQIAARLNATLSSSYYFKSQMPTAAWHLSQVVVNAEKAGDQPLQVRGLRDLLLIEAERGNTARVAELERDIAAISYRGPLGIASYVIGKALVLIGELKFSEAQSVLSSVPRRDLTPHQNRERTGLLAVAAALAGDRSSAHAALTACEKSGREDEQLTVHQRAHASGERFAILASLALGRNAVAQRMLRAIKSTPDGFAALDAGLYAILGRAPERLEEAVRALRLTSLGGLGRVLESVAASLETSQETPGDLTSMELQILRAMAGGWSNKTIAAEQHRTINTVRTHVSSILRKLGSESRGEAVAAARRLGLV
ncbi:MAG: LuxR C-terminal-related transcriptional regulator [Vulcanimicrobiaceae bacterium]